MRRIRNPHRKGRLEIMIARSAIIISNAPLCGALEISIVKADFF